MKPAPLTAEQLLAAGYNSGDPEGLIEFAQGVSDTRDAQWEQMLTEQETISWVDLQKVAQEVVQSKSLWKRFIDGTPLANDIACWMADFAQDHTAPELAQPKPVNQQLLEALKAFVAYADEVNDDSPELDRARATIAVAEGNK